MYAGRIIQLHTVTPGATHRGLHIRADDRQRTGRFFSYSNVTNINIIIIRKKQNVSLPRYHHPLRRDSVRYVEIQCPPPSIRYPIPIILCSEANQRYSTISACVSFVAGSSIARAGIPTANNYSEYLDAEEFDAGAGGVFDVYLANLFPRLKFVVQDLPPVIAGATLSQGLRDRVTFQGHDFFTPQPVVGADVYFSRWILHN